MNKIADPEVKYTAEKHKDAIYNIKEGPVSYYYNGKNATFEEYLSVTEGNEAFHEYINGQIFYLPVQNNTHQQICNIISSIFLIWFINKPEQPLSGDFKAVLKLDEDNINIVYPDIMVVPDRRSCKNKNVFRGKPLLIVEVLSEYTRNKDYIKKLDLYLSAGVREYWIVNPISEEVMVYHFENRNVKRVKIFNYNYGKANSLIFSGLSVKLSDIYADI